MISYSFRKYYSKKDNTNHLLIDFKDPDYHLFQDFLENEMIDKEDIINRLSNNQEKIIKILNLAISTFENFILIYDESGEGDIDWCQLDIKDFFDITNNYIKERDNL